MKKEHFYELAAELEKQCGDWENSEGLSEKTIEELSAGVEALEAEQSAKGSGSSKVPRRRKRYVAVLAAALVLLLGMGVMGGRALNMKSTELERGKEITIKVNNEDKESIAREEEEMFQEIESRLGMVPMRFGYLPEGMTLDSYSIMEGSGCAYAYYTYREDMITVEMIKSIDENAGNIQWDGVAGDLGIVPNEFGCEIRAYCIDEGSRNYGAQILYGSGYYNIIGAFFDQEEFFEILKWIFFKSM